MALSRAHGTHDCDFKPYGRAARPPKQLALSVASSMPSHAAKIALLYATPFDTCWPSNTLSQTKVSTKAPPVAAAAPCQTHFHASPPRQPNPANKDVPLTNANKALFFTLRICRSPLKNGLRSRLSELHPDRYTSARSKLVSPGHDPAHSYHSSGAGPPPHLILKQPSKKRSGF